MSGECEYCGEHTLECLCKASSHYVLSRTCGNGCPCRSKPYYTHLNLVRTLSNPNLPETRYINIRGRTEHEAIIKDSSWCLELGLDQSYETSKYLKRWGSWLQN